MPTRSLPVLLPLLLVPALAAAEPAASCSARSGATAPHVVELYTSEGCNSCPPADRWLGTFVKGRSDVVALAFHVDYWDRLGWADRFATLDWTRRQSATQAHSGARFAYTPQVLVGGRDWRRWPALPEAAPAATVTLSLARDAAGYVARLARLPGAPQRLAGYWAVTEDGHVSQVKSGENAGVTLHHDAVVRELQAVDRIDADGAPLRFTPRSGPDAVSGPRPRTLHFVVTDAATGLPLNALSLRC